MANTHSSDLERDSDQYLFITDGDQTGLDITGDLTKEIWLNLESSPPNGEEWPIISKLDYGASERSYYLSYAYSDPTYYFHLQLSQDGGGTNRDRITWDYTLTGSTWYHVAVSVDISAAVASEALLYINGSSQGNGDVAQDGSITSIYNSNAPFLVGALWSNGSLSSEGTFDGKIDEVRIWNDIRTPTEIADNYQKEIVGSEAGLAGYWKLNNDYLDETSNNNDLTASGSPVFSTDVPFVGTAVKDLLGGGIIAFPR